MDELEQFIFAGLGSDTLSIRDYRTNTYYYGTSSRQVFERCPSEGQPLLLPEQELWFYTNWHLREYLTQLLQPHSKYYIYITAQICFHKMDDQSDRMSISSSYRNNNWLIPQEDTTEYRRSLADGLLAQFSSYFFDDIECVERRRESGWVFRYVESISIVHLKRPPGQVVGYGKMKRTPLKFALPFYKAFRYNVVDPTRFLSRGIKQILQETCVPLSIILYLEFLLYGRLGHCKINYLLRLLAILQITPGSRFSHAIAIPDFPALEQHIKRCFDGFQRNYLFLHRYQGISINLFSVIYAPNQRFYHLVPVHLSEKWNDPGYLQVDLLQDADILRVNTNKKHTNKITTLHTLLILNYARLVTVFGHDHHCPRNIMKACRSCGKTFYTSNVELYNAHTQDCKSHNTKCLGARKVANTIIYKPWHFNKFEQKWRKNYLTFEKRNFYTTLKPLAFFFADFESRNVPFKKDFGAHQHTGVPKTSIFTQIPMAYSITLGTPYKDIQLPFNLKGTTVRILDDTATNSTTNDLYLDFMMFLREKVLPLHSFYRNILQGDPGPPELKSLPAIQRLSYILATHCFYCGAKFGSPRKTGQSRRRSKEVEVEGGQRSKIEGGQRSKVVLKTRHHNHYLANNSLAQYGGNDNGLCKIIGNNSNVIAVCDICNLKVINDAFIALPTTILYHNLSGYDGQIVLKAICNVGAQTFKQMDRTGAVLTLPILHGTPVIRFKDKNKITSITLRFTCPFQATCIHHSLPKDRKKKKRPPCPFFRKYRFMDSLLHLPARYFMIFELQPTN